MTISFESNVLEPKAPATKVLLDAMRRRVGPDGVELEGEWQFVKPGKGTSFVRTLWNLELRTKVRSPVVASWMLMQLKGLDVALLRDGIDYRLDEGALARLIEDASEALPNGTPSDPPKNLGGSSCEGPPGSSTE